MTHILRKAVYILFNFSNMLQDNFSKLVLPYFFYASNWYLPYVYRNQTKIVFLFSDFVYDSILK